MKWRYKTLMFLTLLIFCVGSVCAVEPDNITDFDNNCLSDVNCSNTLNNHFDDVIYNEDNDIDCCGAIAFQSVLKENGINITLEEANKAIHSVNGSTSMQGLVDGAKAYNLTAYPVKINASDLQTNFIVHMNINDTNHWYVISDVINDSDVSDKNIILDIDEFNKYYDNHALLITKDTNLNLNTLSATILSSLECEKIIGNGKVGVLIKILKNRKVRKTINYVYNHPIVKGASIASAAKDVHDMIKEITHKKNKKCC